MGSSPSAAAARRFHSPREWLTGSRLPWRGLPWPGLTWGRVFAAAAALLLLVPNSSVLEHRAVVAAFLVALATGRGREFVRDWLPLVGSAAAFVILRQWAGASPWPHQGLAVAHGETALFGGALPSAWLQDHFYRPGGEGPLDYLATAVHASYFFGFVMVGLGTWFLARPSFGRYWRLLAMTFALGLAGYCLAPTEPPWMLARSGDSLPVRRIIGETTRAAPVSAGLVTAGQRWQRDPDALGDPNPTAAMPSVHTAITASLALFLHRRHRLLGATGAVYVAAMGLSLVYLGEHFVLDVVAGLACAALAWWLSESVERWTIHGSSASAENYSPNSGGRRARMGGDARERLSRLRRQLIRRALAAAPGHPAL